MTVILIDNYDSFTWNVYEYLNKAGGDVQVFRNDKITVKEIEALKPTHLVISPGPGHPAEDNGICREALKYFTGKIPILGVCMGLQIIFDYHGGVVKRAGEILHGKTSPIRHDNYGLYKDFSQDFIVTRYHSLICDPDTLPDSLEITSWSDTGYVMGARHKTYAIEGVQYHPESFLSEDGVKMCRNFLELTSPTWSGNPSQSLSSKMSVEQSLSELPPDSHPVKENILLKIFRQRQIDVNALKSSPGRSLSDLEDLLKIPGMAPPPISFLARLRASKAQNPNSIAVVSEVKRASPSKGDIGINVNAAAMALQYAEAGTSGISVLTEPHWFKGRVEDMLQVRNAISKFGDERPAVLRKDFIFEKYQIAEARLYGADAVLLIVSLLTLPALQELLDYTWSLGMEALVEINTEHEAQLATLAKAKVIGCNNRNLTDFSVEMNNTNKLSKLVPKDSLFIALSGVLTPTDALAFKGSDIGAVLVGEGLMKSQDRTKFISELSNIFSN
ncbi:Multifunctional tryptophan biosynthesis protein [Smittium mucronatum]|uniref:Multifunctional tryptophan biosynthesis protein n=1 Tax=Smittium mucronatum TaxID=133383 RepID=A0A1R0GXF1_9FUNG|nr:Multifunctional tryptophan biosynthesis protein [Smittium mucronatum]